jgi:predicted dehydrogenase
MRSNVKPKYGVGVIGTNFGWTVVAPAIIESSDFELICVANSSPAIPGEFYLESTILRTGKTDLISDPKVDFIWVSSPPETHFGILKEVLRSGKIAICEKPCGVSIAELTALNVLTLNLGLPIFLDFEFRYDPIYTRVFNEAKTIQNGQFLEFNVYWQTNAKLQNRKSYSHKDLLLDFAIHILDCFLNFANDIGAQLVSAEEKSSKCSVCEIHSQNCTAMSILFDRFSLNAIICRNYSGVGIHKVELLKEGSFISSGITHPYSSSNLFYTAGTSTFVNQDWESQLPVISNYSDMRLYSVGLLIENIARYMSSNEDSNRPPDIADAIKVHLLIDRILESRLN